MANWRKSGAGDNVDSGPGSKKGRKEGKSVPEVRQSPDAMRSTVDKNETTHDVDFAKGGDTPMFGEQEAGSRTSADKSPSTGKPDSSGPGEKFAEGGTNKMFGYAGSQPATAGITSAR
jgi:hypothetical protein